MSIIPDNIRGIIFDYGGTLDSRGDHWSEVIYDQYQKFGLPVSYEQFRPAYIHGERFLAANPVVEPQDDFRTLMLRKVSAEFNYLFKEGVMDPSMASRMALVANACYEHARECVSEATPVLEKLAENFPLALVSNFYGNICAVLNDFGIRHLFQGIVESSVIGIRKPDPRIFGVGCMVLDLPPQRVLVVGDSISKDIEPAEKLGCSTVFIGGRPWRGDPEPTLPSNRLEDLIN